MGAGQTVGKCIATIALIMLFINLIVPGNTAWTGFQSALATPFPAFGNPLTLNTKTITIYPRANDSWGRTFVDGTYGHNAVSPSGANVYTDGSDPRCGAGSHVSGVTPYPGSYWPCVTTDDGDKSGIILPGLSFTNANGVEMNGYTWGVRMDNITGIDVQDQIVNITLHVKCNTQSSLSVGFTAYLSTMFPVLGQEDGVTGVGGSSAGMEVVGNQKCAYGGVPGATGVGPNFFDVTLLANYQNGILVSTQRLQNFTHTHLVINAQTWAHDVVISYLYVTIAYLDENSSSLNSQCNTFDIGCQAAKIWNSAVGFILFLVNGAIWAGGVALWFVTILATFAWGLVGSLIWLLAIPAPFSPPAVVQGILDIVILGLLGEILIVGISEVRGTGTVPV